METRSKATDQTVTPETAAVKLKVSDVTIMERVYFSSYHLWAARYFARCAAEIENADKAQRFDIKQRVNVTGAVLSAIAFLEAAINEFFKDIVEGSAKWTSTIATEPRQLISALWAFTEERNRSPFSVLDKYQLALRLYKHEQFTPGAQPYQDAALAIKLRNELMHYHPGTYGGDTQHKLSKQLRNKFSDNPLMNSCANAYFPDKCLGSPCAEWAIRSATALADAFFEKLNLVPHYQMVEFEQRSARSGELGTPQGDPMKDPDLQSSVVHLGHQ